MKHLLLSLLCGLLFIISLNTTKASVTVLWANSGSDVVATYSGSIDLTGYSLGNFVTNRTRLLLDSSNNFFFGNVPASTQTHYSKLANTFVNTGFDTGGFVDGTYDGAEEAFGFGADASSTNVYVEPGYVSGNAMSGEALFENMTLTDIFGTDIFNFLAFDDGTNTVHFQAIPEPSRLVLLLGGIAAIGLRRRCG